MLVQQKDTVPALPHDERETPEMRGETIGAHYGMEGSCHICFGGGCPHCVTSKRPVRSIVNDLKNSFAWNRNAEISRKRCPKLEIFSSISRHRDY
jgi:hypothetical protein